MSIGLIGGLMSATPNIEDLVLIHGEEYRKLMVCAIEFAKERMYFNYDDFDCRIYIHDLIRSAKKSKNNDWCSRITKVSGLNY